MRARFTLVFSAICIFACAGCNAVLGLTDSSYVADGSPTEDTSSGDVSTDTAPTPDTGSEARGDTALDSSVDTSSDGSAVARILRRRELS